MEENGIGRSIEDILTIQQGGRLGIPSRTLRKLEIKDGDLVFVKLTKAYVSKEASGFWEQRRQELDKQALTEEENKKGE